MKVTSLEQKKLKNVFFVNSNLPKKKKKIFLTFFERLMFEKANGNKCFRFNKEFVNTFLELQSPETSFIPSPLPSTMSLKMISYFPLRLRLKHTLSKFYEFLKFHLIFTHSMFENNYFCTIFLKCNLVFFMTEFLF